MYGNLSFYPPIVWRFRRQFQAAQRICTVIASRRKGRSLSQKRPGTIPVQPEALGRGEKFTELPRVLYRNLSSKRCFEIR